MNLREFWGTFHPLGFDRGIFGVLKGYLDESVSGNKSVFGFSCVFSDGSTWERLEKDWIAVLAEKNRDLVASGRPPISRYHASECSTNTGEFETWSPDNHYAESTEFFKKLLAVLKTYPMNGIGYTIYTDDLRAEIPESVSKEEGYGYAIILQYIMRTIGSFMIGGQNATDRIVLFNDRCDYDSVLLQTFKMMIERGDFSERGVFTSLTSTGWEDCISLQPADLIAYENMKESEKHLNNRLCRRKSLTAILELDNFGGKLEHLDRGTIRDLKQYVKDDAATRGIIDVIWEQKRK